MKQNQLLTEPLTWFYKKTGFNRENISRFTAGEKYIGIILKNGNTGVCATLGEKVTGSLIYSGEPDLASVDDRIVLNAYFNALHNYSSQNYEEGDIFTPERFSSYQNIVMIGWFGSLTEKFKNMNIALTIFDRLSDDSILTPMSEQTGRLATADCVILTGTTIHNSSFTDIIAKTADNCDILLLGPSNILHRDMFRYHNIKVVYGSLFEKNDHQLLDLIAEGHGTKGFLHKLRKVYITNN